MSRFIIIFFIITIYICSISNAFVEELNTNCTGWGQMKCWSGQCVNITGKCNGVRDCADGSDERRLFCSTSLCETDQFQCGYGACIPKQAKCNGTQECWDGTDELEKLCKKEVYQILTPTTKLNLTIVTESILNPRINAINTNKSTDTNVYDFKASENLKNTTTQTTTNHVQIENKEFKNTNYIENPLDKRNGPKSTPKTSTRHPIATTSAENFGMDLNEIASTNLMKPTIEANKIKKYAEDDLQITTPKIKVTTKIPTLITNRSFKIDISTYPSSKQAPNFETNLNSGIDNSLVSNSTDQIPPISRPSTEIVHPIVKHPGSLTGISEWVTNTSKVKTAAKPQTVGTITPNTTKLPPTTIPAKRQQTVFNRYETRPTTPTKPIKECLLRYCDHPLFCKISFPGSRNSEIAIVDQGRLSLIVGSQVFFNCAEGYDLEGANRLTCTQTGWSHSSPSCIPYCDADFIHNCRPPLRCLFEQSNSRSKIFITKEFKQRVREHSQISFACDEGYLHEGPTMRKCTARGWSNEIPRCINHCDISELEPLNSPLKCKVFDSNIQSLKDYKYSVWNKRIKERSYFEFTCEDGYKLDGDNRSTCMNNGWSSAAPTCIRSCELSVVSPCSAPLLCQHNHKRSFFNFGNRADVVLPGVHVDYSCEDGYELDGAKVITCTNNGWSNRIPTCKETICDASILADCTHPLKCEIYDRTVRKYQRIYIGDMPQFFSNDWLKISCEDGYTLQGSQYLDCRRGKWEIMPKCIAAHSCSGHLIPNCEYPLTCTLFDSRSKSEQMITNNNIIQSTNYALNTQIIFGCANGYKLKGEEQTICSSNGWSHEQSLKLPQCTIASPCDPDIFGNCEEPLNCFYMPPKQEKWFLVTSAYLQYEVRKNSLVDFRCNEGFRLEGPRRINCTSRGWDQPVPICV